MVECGTTLSVKCGDLVGKLLLDKFTARLECVSCEHGLVKPAVFERLAGKGHCKSWKRTVRCVETGKDLYSLIESGALKLLDKVQVNSENGDSYTTLRRKRLLLEQEKENHNSVCSNKETNGDQQSNASACIPPKNTDKLKDETPKDGIRKRKKLEDGKHTPNAVKTNKGTRNSNNGVDLNRLSEQFIEVEDSSSSEVSYEIYRTRVPRHGRCKRKRIHCNEQAGPSSAQHPEDVFGTPAPTATLTITQLAGKGHCKSWKRTIRCVETGKDLYTLVESGALKLLDEPKGMKKRKSLKTSPEIGGDKVNSENGDCYTTLRRKHGRPRKNAIQNDGVEYSSSSEVSNELYRTRLPRHGRCKRKSVCCNEQAGPSSAQHLEDVFGMPTPTATLTITQPGAGSGGSNLVARAMMLIPKNFTMTNAIRPILDGAMLDVCDDQSAQVIQSHLVRLGWTVVVSAIWPRYEFTVPASLAGTGPTDTGLDPATIVQGLMLRNRALGLPEDALQFVSSSWEEVGGEGAGQTQRRLRVWVDVSPGGVEHLQRYSFLLRTLSSPVRLWPDTISCQCPDRLGGYPDRLGGHPPFLVHFLPHPQQPEMIKLEPTPAEGNRTEPLQRKIMQAP